MREMSEVERAWIGAMLEAEGNTGFTNKKKYGNRHSYIKFVNTDVELISAFLRVTGTGRVYTYPGTGIGKKRVYAWQVSRKVEVNNLVRQCVAYAPKLTGGIMRG